MPDRADDPARLQRKIFKFLKKKYKEHKAQKAQGAAGQSAPQGGYAGAASGGAWQGGQQTQQQPTSYYQQQQGPPPQQGYQAHPAAPSQQQGGWSTSTDEGLGGDATDLRNQAIREGDLMSQCAASNFVRSVFTYGTDTVFQVSTMLTKPTNLVTAAEQKS